MFKLVVLAITTWGSAFPTYVNPYVRNGTDKVFFQTMEECQKQAEYYKSASDSDVQFKAFCVQIVEQMK